MMITCHFHVTCITTPQDFFWFHMVPFLVTFMTVITVTFYVIYVIYKRQQELNQQQVNLPQPQIYVIGEAVTGRHSRNSRETVKLTTP